MMSGVEYKRSEQKLEERLGEKLKRAREDERRVEEKLKRQEKMRCRAQVSGWNGWDLKRG